MATTGGEGARRSAWLAWLLALVALGFVAHALRLSALAYHPLPVADQWGVVVDLERWERGEWRVTDLWKQHNEHRWLVPRLLFLADLGAAQGRSVLSHAATPAVLLLHLGLLVALVRRVAPAGPVRLGLSAGVAILLFSAAQLENLESALGFAFVFVCFAASLACACLAGAGERAARGAPWRAWLLAALAAGAAASATMANGLAVWPVLLALALWLRLPRAATALLAAAALALGAAYFAGYARPTGHASPLGALRAPGHVLAYLAVFVGSPFRALGSAGAGACGAMALGAGAFGLLQLARREPRSPALGALAGAGLFAAASAALVALGRVEHPLEQALESRYASFALVVWAAELGLLAAALGSRGRWRLPALAGVLVLVLPLLPLQREAERELAARRPAVELAALALVLDVQDPRVLAQIHPKPAKVLRLAPVLRRHGLAIFAERPPPLGARIAERFAALPESACRGELASVEPIEAEPGGAVRAGGWAWEVARGAPPARILLSDPAGVVVGAGVAGVAVTEAWRKSAAIPERRAGWRGFARAAPGTALEAWAVTADGASVCRLAGRKLLPGPRRAR